MRNCASATIHACLLSLARFKLAYECPVNYSIGISPLPKKIPIILRQILINSNVPFINAKWLMASPVTEARQIGLIFPRPASAAVGVRARIFRQSYVQLVSVLIVRVKVSFSKLIFYMVMFRFTVNRHEISTTVRAELLSIRKCQGIVSIVDLIYMRVEY